MTKKLLIEAILNQLRKEIQALELSAQAAHAAATHEESKAEDSHDTRGLEASYLAGAQNARIETLKKNLTYYQFTEFRDFQPNQSIGPGALIEINSEAGKPSYYFLVSQSGGMTVSLDGIKILVITPQAPLGEALLDRHVGDEIEVETQNAGTREYEIISVI